jgi:transposase
MTLPVERRRLLSQPISTVAPMTTTAWEAQAATLPTVMQAYRFALDPTPRQRRALASHCGAARVAYNCGLELVTARLAQRRAGEDVEMPWTLPELRREWNRARDQVAPWWPENSKEAYDSGLNGLARALKNFSDSKQGRRKGRQMGFPRRKTKRHARVACRFSKGQRIKVLSDRKHVQLPRIGVLKTHESTRRLARRLEKGTARILAATISRRAERWFVSFTCEVQRTIPVDNGKPGVVGVDVGIRHLAVLSTGTVFPNPRALDALHKLTTALVMEYGTVVVEQLNVTERIFHCEACGLVIDRDLNAARNLAKLVGHVARSGRETRTACVRDCQPTVLVAGPATPTRERSRRKTAGSQQPVRV